MSRARCRRAPLLLGLLAGIGHSASCAASAQGCDSLTGTPIVFGVDWQTDIKPIFNEKFTTGRCTSCHNAGQLDGGLDLTDFGIDAIYKIVPAVIEPGRPRGSLLFLKINCDAPPVGQRMPLGGLPLTLDEQILVFDWIAQGALGDLPDEPPIPRDFLFADGLESLHR